MNSVCRARQTHKKRKTHQLHTAVHRFSNKQRTWVAGPLIVAQKLGVCKKRDPPIHRTLKKFVKRASRGFYFTICSDKRPICILHKSKRFSTQPRRTTFDCRRELLGNPVLWLFTDTDTHRETHTDTHTHNELRKLARYDRSRRGLCALVGFSRFAPGASWRAQRRSLFHCGESKRSRSL